MNAQTNAGTLAGRILLALIFIVMGLGKLAAPQPTIQYIEAAGIPAAQAAYWAAVSVEVVGGLLLLVGYQARLAALALAGFTVVAAIFFHSNLADQNQFTHFMKNLAIAGGLIHVAALGAGGLSLDGRRAQKVPSAAI